MSLVSCPSLSEDTTCKRLIFNNNELLTKITLYFFVTDAAGSHIFYDRRIPYHAQHVQEVSGDAWDTFHQVQVQQVKGERAPLPNGEWSCDTGNIH